MKVKSSLLVLLIIFSNFLFSQETLEKEIDVFVIEEVNVRKTSIGVVGGVVKYFGEESTNLTYDYGLVLKNHINSKFDLDYNLHFGETNYVIDSLDFNEKISYYGANAVFNINLIEAFTKKEGYSKFSPYIGGGVGVLSSRPLRSAKKYVFFYVPLSVGLNINVSDRFIVGLHATGRVLLSDEWDNSKITSAKDFLFNPSVSLKYVIARKKKRKTKYVTQTIKYSSESVNNQNDLEKYQEKEIESFVEVSSKDFTIVSSSVNIEKKKETETLTTASDYLFYTIQIATFSSGNYNIDEATGTKTDFKFYNTKTKRYNYCKGFYKNTKEARSDLKQIKLKNPNAFITAIHKKEKIKIFLANSRVKSGEAKINIESAKVDYIK